MTLLIHRPERTAEAAEWTGGYRRYDLVKEFVVALVAVALLTILLAALFSSPDEKQVTVGQWAKAAPNDFVATAATELDGTSGTATYGAPYNNGGGEQKLGPLALQKWAGKSIPVDTADDFVLTPLRSLKGEPTLDAALARWDAATSDQQLKWASAYDNALQKAPDNDPAKVKAGDYGPVPTMLTRLLRMGQSGTLTGAILTEGTFYQTDYTKPLMFIADGAYLEDLARGQHLGGDQWGMMNETGNYPGQAWLWLYTLWYQVPPYSTSGNADALVWGTMMVLTAGFVLVPFIPGVRSLPRRLGVYKLIWREHYRSLA